MTLGCNDTRIRKSEFVAKTQFQSPCTLGRFYLKSSANASEVSYSPDFSLFSSFLSGEFIDREGAGTDSEEAGMDWEEAGRDWEGAEMDWEGGECGGERE